MASHNILILLKLYYNKHMQLIHWKKLTQTIHVYLQIIYDDLQGYNNPFEGV